MPAASLSADIDPARFDGGFAAPSTQQQVSDAMHQVDASVGRVAPGQPAGVQPGIDKALRDATVAKMAEQYGQYRTPTSYQQVRDKMQAKPAPVMTEPVAPAPVEVSEVDDVSFATPETVDDIAVEAETEIAAAPQETLAAPSTTEAAAGSAKAPSAPAARAYDVYSGLATEAKDVTGQNTVTRDALGRTAVTNKHGVTTVTMPDGKQAATSAPFSGDINAALGSMSAPSLSKGLGGKSKVADIGSSLAGAIAGGLLTGSPLGAVLGAKLANTAVMGVKPDSLLGKAMGLNTFPDAPKGGAGGGMRDSFSASERASMASISPGAAAAVGTSKGGLY